MVKVLQVKQFCVRNAWKTVISSKMWKASYDMILKVESATCLPTTIPQCGKSAKKTSTMWNMCQQNFHNVEHVTKYSQCGKYANKTSRMWKLNYTCKILMFKVSYTELWWAGMWHFDPNRSLCIAFERFSFCQKCQNHAICCSKMSKSRCFLWKTFGQISTLAEGLWSIPCLFFCYLHSCNKHSQSY